MFKSVIGILFFLLMSDLLYAQVGGRSFEFMNVPSFARETGLGGINVSLANQDINMIFNNPALASDSLSGHVAFNYLSYFADVHGISFVYQHGFERYGPWFFGANHLDYGSIEGFDKTGASLGETNADETVIFVGSSHRVGHFTLGASLKFINSNITGFSATAMALDIGGAFIHPTRNLSAGLVFKNIGIILSDYSVTTASQLPFDVQAGVSFKPEHMPVRFSFTGYNLYNGPNDLSPDRQGQYESNPALFNKIFRHVVVGTELMLTENFNLRFGYNHLVRQELRLEEASGGAGFSCGIMVRIRALEFAYSRGGYHVSGGSHNFTFTANTKLFFRKGKLL